MTTVSNSFKGYQYYEFALLKDLIPESRKLAEQTSQSFDADEDRLDDGASITEGSLIEAAKEVTKGGQEGDASNGTGSSLAEAAKPPENLLPEAEIDKQLDNLFSTGETAPIGVSSSEKSLDELFSASAPEDKEMDVFQPFEKAPSTGASRPSEDTDFLKDILSLSPHTPNLFDVPTSPQQTSAAGIGDSFFRVNWDSQLSDVFSSARTGSLSQLPSMGMPHAIGGLQEPSQQKPQPSASAKPTPTPKKPESGDVEAWMKFFADLTPLSNPDQQSTKKGHVLDA